MIGPKHDWRQMPLGELGRWIGGGTPPKANRAYWTEGTIPWISPKDMKTPRITDGVDRITKEAIDKSATNLISRGSVLVVVRSGILKHTLPVAVAMRDVALNQDMKAFSPRPDILPDYIALALKAFERDILHTCTKNGVTVQSIIMPSLLRFKIPVPPVGTQKALVSALDRSFSQLDSGIANVLRAKANLIRYRTSLLNAASRGTLATAPCVHSSNPISDMSDPRSIHTLMEAHWPSRGSRNNVKTPSELDLPPLPRRWEYLPVAQLVTERPCNGISVKGRDEPPGVRALRLSAMSDRGFDYGEVRYLPLKSSAVEDVLIRENDFFVCRGNGSIHLVGRGTLAQRPLSPTIFPDTMIRLRLNRRLLHPRWISTIWQSPIVRRQIEEKAKTTAGIYKISQFDVAGIYVPAPPLSDQERIVTELERKFSVIQQIEATISANILRASRLREAVFRKAFGRSNS